MDGCPSRVYSLRPTKLKMSEEEQLLRETLERWVGGIEGLDAEYRRMLLGNCDSVFDVVEADDSFLLSMLEAWPEAQRRKFFGALEAKRRGEVDEKEVLRARVIDLEEELLRSRDEVRLQERARARQDCSVTIARLRARLDATADEQEAKLADAIVELARAALPSRRLDAADAAKRQEATKKK